MQFYKYTIVMTPDEKDSSVYNVSVPALPEITTFGDSIAEARFMAQDAIELVVLSRLERGETIPTDRKPKKIFKNAVADQIFVTVSHEVKTAPIDHVKHSLFEIA